MEDQLELDEGGILRSGHWVGIKMSKRKAFELGELYECVRDCKTAWLIYFLMNQKLVEGVV